MYSADFTVPAGTYEYKVAHQRHAGTRRTARTAARDNIPLVVAGPSTLRFTYDDTTHRIALTPLDLGGDYTPADDALVAHPVRDPGADQQFYFVMTDRFADGDDANDTGGLTGDRLATGFDPTDKGFYEGGDLAGLHDKLDYIEGLGTTAIWLTPSFKNRPVQGTGADASAGYHGYWITDFTQIDPHLGTNAELEALIADAHARGIDVYFDIITNHTADVIDYAEGQYGYVDQATSPYTDAARHGVRPGHLRGHGHVPDDGRRDELPVHAGDRARGRGRQGPGLAERPDALPQPRELDLQRGVDDVRRLLRPGRPHDREPGGRGRLRGRLQPVGRPGRRRLPHRHRQARQLRVLAEVHDGACATTRPRSATTTSSCSARSTTPTRSSWRRTCATAT